MATYVRTRDWTSTEACEVIELVEKRSKTKSAKDSINQDLCWLNATIRKNPEIEWVVLLKNPPEEKKKIIQRSTFQAYLVRRLERERYPDRKVWMMYIVPR